MSTRGKPYSTQLRCLPIRDITSTSIKPYLVIIVMVASVPKITVPTYTPVNIHINV